MPTYEYECNACKADFEVDQRISEPAHATCPVCASTDTRRLISLSSFVLKGTGWYATDYGSKGSSCTGQHKPAKHADTSPKTAAATTAGADSKPTAKAEAGANRTVASSS